jgi:hypothetical protein
MNLQTKFNRYIISGQNILEDCHLSELSSCYLYELITGNLPCEISQIEYSNELIEFLEKNNRGSNYDFELISLYNWNKENWNFESPELDGTIKDTTYYWLYSRTKDLLVKIEGDDGIARVSIASANISSIQNFLEFTKKLLYKKKENKIGIINAADSGRLSIRKISIDPVEIDIELNYGKEFVNVNKSILKKLEEKRTGLFLLHSTPGNGKSYYIKYLAQTVKDKLFIFIPTSMIDSIVQPSLISLLLDYPNSVLIIEDAEQAIMSRDENPANASLVSNILNISDGILGSMLNVALILTFNTERTNIDKALLRKGRLQAEWEFKELSAENAKKLAKKLGKDVEKIDKPTKICDIYNADDINFHKEADKEERIIGFGK